MTEHSHLSARAEASLALCVSTDIEMSTSRNARQLNRARQQHWEALRALFLILELER